MKTVIRHLRRAALLQMAEGLTDSQLLEAFLARREEAAFEALLRRHGPMVLGVCQRVLRNMHDAEDAFQATFMVLTRKASSLSARELLANWLYGVAYRTAKKAQAMNAKRRLKERQAGEMPRSLSSVDEELLERLDQEMSRLPEKYRAPIILCELQGRTRKEVAGMLGIPEGTLSSRLAQAKKLLARKLSRYGTVAMAALLAQSAASACLSPILRTSTMKAALTAGAVPAQVLALTEGVMKVMLLSKLKITVCAATLMLMAGVGATGLTYRATAQQPKRESALANRSQADELEALRLEFEAMRKSLQATRERVKALEDEVRTLKRGSMRPGTSTPRTVPASNLQTPLPTVAPASTAPSNNPQSVSSIAPALETRPQPSTNAQPSAASSPPSTASRSSSAANGTAPTAESRPEAAHNAPSAFTKPAKTDPLARAEKALKQLRANPNDRQAADALEKALKQLRERQQPNMPDGETRRGAN